MKIIKINVKNEKAIQAALDEVQRRASARTVNYKSVLSLKQDLIEKLQNYNVPKKFWKGCSARFMEYVNCNSYSNRGSYSADSTCIVVTCTGKDFFLTDCCRVSLPTHRRAGYNYNFKFTKQAAEAGMKKTYEKSLVTVEL